MQTEPGWHVDPTGRYQFRYWDGTRWTEHVASNGRRGADNLESTHSAQSKPERRIQQQIVRSDHGTHLRGGNLASLDEPVLAINQRGKLVELRADYGIFNESGVQIGAVRGKRVSSRLRVVDAHGGLLLDLRRQMSGLGSKVIVTGPDGTRIGRVAISLSPKHPDRRFKIEDSDDRLIGSVYSEDAVGKRHRRAEFNVQDVNGNIAAQITKTYAGVAKELLTKGDNYVVSFTPAATHPLKSLIVATTLIVDTRFHQR